MATQSLYRRYRPRRFSELKGQDHIVRALRTSVAEGREGQAYLFSGPRGTGKTTTARIMAKVLNCQNAEGGEPCEQAYNGMTAMVAALQKNMPAGGMQPNVPTRDQYLTACRQLPEDAQQCSVPAYAMQNMESCQAIMQRPEVQQKMAELRAMVQGNAN